MMVESLLHKGFERPGIGLSTDDESENLNIVQTPFPDDFDENRESDLSDTKADLPAGQLIVSVDKAGSSMTLHRLGACWRIPGVHYRKYRIVELDGVEEECCDNLCKDCWPTKVTASLDLEMDGESSSSSDSESDS